MSEQRQKVFLSHSAKDKQQLEPLISYLKAHDVELFVDDVIRTSGSIDDEIELQIESSSCVVAAWSIHSVSSSWFKGELHFALRKRIKTIHLTLDGTEPKIPFNTPHTLDIANLTSDDEDPICRRILIEVQTVDVESFTDRGLKVVGPSATAWQGILRSTNPQDYRRYINKYPESQNRSLAIRRLAQLEIWETVKNLEPEFIERFIDQSPYPSLAAVAITRLEISRKNMVRSEEFLSEYKRLMTWKKRLRYIPDDEQLVLYVALISGSCWGMYHLFTAGLPTGTVIKQAAKLLLGYIGMIFLSGVIFMYPIAGLYWFLDRFMPITEKARIKSAARMKEIETDCPWILEPNCRYLAEQVQSADFDLSEPVNQLVNRFDIEQADFGSIEKMKE